MQKITVEVEGKSTLPLDALEPFQDKIKILERAQFEKFRRVLIEQGISFVVHVWKSGKKNFIIDGHQRVYALKKMRDEEDFKIPSIPVSFVKAKSLKEAKLKVLSGASQFGSFDAQALEKYLLKNKIDMDLALASFDFPEVDLKALSLHMDQVEALPEPKGGDGNMKVSSDEVKQVQLYFDIKSHGEFMRAAEELAQIYGTENITDTVLRAMNEELKTRSK
jgi:hypothetical protein